MMTIPKNVFHNAQVPPPSVKQEKTQAISDLSSMFFQSVNTGLDAGMPQVSPKHKKAKKDFNPNELLIKKLQKKASATDLLKYQML